MSLVDEPLFDRIRHYMHADVYLREGGGSANPRYRIEVDSKVPDQLRTEALALTMPCVTCRYPIHPFRVRRGRNSGNHTIYFAATCPLNQNIGCSRSQRAAEEYRRVITAIKREEKKLF